MENGWRNGSGIKGGVGTEMCPRGLFSFLSRAVNVQHDTVVSRPAAVAWRRTQSAPRALRTGMIQGR
jgi:hypothetical protein